MRPDRQDRPDRPDRTGEATTWLLAGLSGCRTDIARTSRTFCPVKCPGWNPPQKIDTYPQIFRTSSPHLVAGPSDANFLFFVTAASVRKTRNETKATGLQPVAKLLIILAKSFV